MHVLLPPSEGKSLDAGTGTLRTQAPELLADLGPVLEYLRRLKKKDLPKVYGVKDPAKAAAWHERTLRIEEAPCLPALQRYTGVVYSALDPASMKRRRQAGKEILIVSALFGLIPGEACIPAYKLPLNPWLARYWKAINGARLARLAKGRPVRSLLPQAHAKAVEYAPLVHVDFRIAGGRKAAGHGGKAVKGRFARFVVEQRVTRVEDFAEFREEGYRFDGENFVQGE